MNKKILAIVAVIAVITAITVAYLIGKNDGKSVNNESKTESTKSEDFRKCVNDGGDVSYEIAPSRCVIDGKNYYDGNF